jgi:hypothetical protein
VTDFAFDPVRREHDQRIVDAVDAYSSAKREGYQRLEVMPIRQRPTGMRAMFVGMRAAAQQIIAIGPLASPALASPAVRLAHAVLDLVPTEADYEALNDIMLDALRPQEIGASRPCAAFRTASMAGPAPAAQPSPTTQASPEVEAALSQLERQTAQLLRTPGLLDLRDFINPYLREFISDAGRRLGRAGEVLLPRREAGKWGERGFDRHWKRFVKAGLIDCSGPGSGSLSNWTPLGRAVIQHVQRANPL